MPKNKGNSGLQSGENQQSKSEELNGTGPTEEEKKQIRAQWEEANKKLDLIAQRVSELQKKKEEQQSQVSTEANEIPLAPPSEPVNKQATQGEGLLPPPPAPLDDADRKKAPLPDPENLPPPPPEQVNKQPAKVSTLGDEGALPPAPPLPLDLDNLSPPRLPRDLDNLPLPPPEQVNQQPLPPPPVPRDEGQSVLENAQYKGDSPTHLQKQYAEKVINSNPDFFSEQQKKAIQENPGEYFRTDEGKTKLQEAYPSPSEPANVRSASVTSEATSTPLTLEDKEAVEQNLKQIEERANKLQQLLNQQSEVSSTKSHVEPSTKTATSVNASQPNEAQDSFSFGDTPSTTQKSRSQASSEEIDPITDAIRLQVIEKQQTLLALAMEQLHKEEEDRKLFHQSLNKDGLNGYVKTEQGKKDLETLQKDPEFIKKLNAVEVEGYKNVIGNKDHNFQDLKWDQGEGSIKSKTITNAQGEELATLTETTHNAKPVTVKLADGTEQKISSYRTVDFPTELSDEAKGKGPMHVSLALKDADGKNIEADKALYFTAHYDKAGKLTEVSSPQPVKFAGTGDDAVGYIEREGKVYTIAVDQGTYKSMMQKVEQNRGAALDLSQQVEPVRATDRVAVGTEQQPERQKNSEVKGDPLNETLPGVNQQNVTFTTPNSKVGPPPPPPNLELNTKNNERSNSNGNGNVTLTSNAEVSNATEVSEAEAVLKNYEIPPRPNAKASTPRHEIPPSTQSVESDASKINETNNKGEPKEKLGYVAIPLSDLKKLEPSPPPESSVSGDDFPKVPTDVPQLPTTLNEGNSQYRKIPKALEPPLQEQSSVKVASSQPASINSNLNEDAIPPAPPMPDEPAQNKGPEKKQQNPDKPQQQGQGKPAFLKEIEDGGVKLKPPPLTEKSADTNNDDSLAGTFQKALLNKFKGTKQEDEQTFEQFVGENLQNPPKISEKLAEVIQTGNKAEVKSAIDVIEEAKKSEWKLEFGKDEYKAAYNQAMDHAAKEQDPSQKASIRKAAEVFTEPNHTAVTGKTPSDHTARINIEDKPKVQQTINR